MIALAFSCDVLNCGTRVVTVEPFEDPVFSGVSAGYYGDNGGWVDGTFSMPEGWKVDGDTGKMRCPEHAS